eukprot:60991-Chlamydomonas_euryale.AAC.2
MLFGSWQRSFCEGVWVGVCDWAWAGLHGDACDCMGLHGASQNCMGLHRTACDCMGLHGAAQNCMGLHRTACDCMGLHRTPPGLFPSVP